MRVRRLNSGPAAAAEPVRAGPFCDTEERMVIRVCSYNVLCSHLSAPSHFRSCKPENLDPSNRLKKILDKLEAEVKLGSICCLQEISMTWSGDFHKFFLDRDYYFMPSLYGSSFSNYMGIGIAFPRSRYTLLHTETRCVAESKQLTRPAIAKSPAMLKKLPHLLWISIYSCIRRAWQLISRTLQLIGLKKQPHPFVIDQDKCCWEVSLDRRNTLIFLRLQENTSAEGQRNPRSFCVATYHMPCVFWDERVMVRITSPHLSEELKFAVPCSFECMLHSMHAP